KEASDPAKKVIKDWCEPTKHDQKGLAFAILEIFDRIYRRPLLSWPAFRRSTAITTLVTAIVLYMCGPKAVSTVTRIFVYGDPDQSAILGVALLSMFLANVFADYISLFAVRYALVKGTTHATFLNQSLAAISVFLWGSMVVLVAIKIQLTVVDSLLTQMYR